MTARRRSRSVSRPMMGWTPRAIAKIRACVVRLRGVAEIRGKAPKSILVAFCIVASFAVILPSAGTINKATGTDTFAEIGVNTSHRLLPDELAAISEHVEANAANVYGDTFLHASDYPELSTRSLILAAADDENLARIESADGNSQPQMVTLPSGVFLMGSSPSETGHVKNEAPQHEVQVEAFAVSKFEITEHEFQTFLNATARTRDRPCNIFENGAWIQRTNFSGEDWLPEENEPAICVTWDQAVAFANWLSEQTGQPYRLVTEAEWEYAAREGTKTAFSFGNDPETGCRHMNGADQSAEETYKKLIGVSCDDGFSDLSPVGSLSPNKFGLYDMHGNVWEWTSDAWTDSHEPGSIPDEKRVIKGGSWFSYAMWLRSANRNAWDPNIGRADVGFRIVRDVSVDQ